MTASLTPSDRIARIDVVEPEGRATRFFLGAWPTRTRFTSFTSAPTEASIGRDVLVLMRADGSAAAHYAARQDALPEGASAPGHFAVIDASTPNVTRLLRDGWEFFYEAPRGAGEAWLHRCAAWVASGYALHDALCLALAQVAVAEGAPLAGVDVEDGARQHVADVLRDGLPPLAAFPGVSTPRRIAGRPADEKVAESPFDERSALVVLALAETEATDEADGANKGGAATDDHAANDVKPAPASSTIETRPGIPSSLPDFPRCRAPLGLYPIAPSADWVRRLIDAGARTIQLRIKSDASSPAAEHAEIQRAVAYCRAASAPIQLFINDHWRLAIDAGAYGVHLGQEDLAALPHFALDAIASAGLRLGLSTHGYYEMLLALRFRPSYIACGPVFATATKAVAVPPQGLQRLAAYCRLLHDAQPPVPVVAIGGIGQAQLAAVRAAGADSAAVVSALVNRSNAMDGNALTHGVSALQAAFNG